MKHIIYTPRMKKHIYDINYDISFQNLYIHNLYHDISFTHDKYINTELKKKFSSYKQQDKLKRKYDPELHITYSEMINQLYECGLKCYYCKCDVLIVYNQKNDMTQWSLERFNNNIGHYNNNTCIACLKCNLQRRTDNHEYFKWSKQINITRTN